ncbi:peptidoglycan-binding protein [Gracilibacillus timonensis]|uniref:peptidoglycan-binding protein n=1 Tax=Gracilibacillus timonensis TaxID=1816696 RepID=UPI0008270840|nr:peptidoglycan-binding protein [Gracilibacillus timonensis]
MMQFPGLLYGVGSADSNVTEIQQRLNALGFNVGNVDGIFGEGTEEGVKAFQKDNRLNPDGIVGKLTWDKLFNDSSASGNHPYPQQLIGTGSAGPNVELVQQRLNSMGYNAGVADGIFGPGTRQAVISFQGDHFISTDGIVGEVTWNILFKGTANGIGATYPGYVLSVGSQGDSVKIIQNQLNRLGFNVGSADGIFGAGTENGVKAYQESRNLAMDGIVGPNTWNKLMSDSQTGENVNNNTPFPGVLLGNGSAGSHVRLVQERLNELNFFVGIVDGIYGPKTEQKVKSYQTSKQLQADGIVGRLTWDALFSNTTANVDIPYPGTLLGIGSSGSNVTRVQSQLNNMGFNAGAEDGIYGAGTAAAVRRFQLSKGLDRDGVVGPLTWNAMFNGVSVPSPDTTEENYSGLVREGDTGSAVQQIQQKLIDLGYSVGTADGIFGPMTRRSVEAFQHDRGLDVDGIVGPMTWNSLFSTSHPGNNGGSGGGSVGGPGTVGKLKKIIIDAGHGGSDPGAVGNGLREKDLVLEISKRQQELLVEAGYVVGVTRAADNFISLSDRTTTANNWGAELYISNHINAGGGRGAEVYHSIYGGRGKTLAEEIMKNLSSIFVSRGTKSRQGQNGDYYHVIRETNMPSVLIEHGFIDNTTDANILKNQNNIERMARATVDAVKAIFPPEEEEEVKIKPNSFISRAFNVVDELSESNPILPGIESPFTIGGVKFNYQAHLEKEGSVNWNITRNGFTPEDLFDSFAAQGLDRMMEFYTSASGKDEVAAMSETFLRLADNIEEIRVSVLEITPKLRGFVIKPFEMEFLTDTGYGEWKIREIITLENEFYINDDTLDNLKATAVTALVGIVIIAVIGMIAAGAASGGLVFGAAFLIAYMLGREVTPPTT